MLPWVADGGNFCLPFHVARVIIYFLVVRLRSGLVEQLLVARCVSCTPCSCVTSFVLIYVLSFFFGGGRLSVNEKRFFYSNDGAASPCTTGDKTFGWQPFRIPPDIVARGLIACPRRAASPGINRPWRLLP